MAIQATELKPKIAVDAHKHDSFASKRERTFIVKFEKVLFNLVVWMRKMPGLNVEERRDNEMLFAKFVD